MPSLTPTTSVLGYAQYEDWAYQPFGTGFDTTTPPQAVTDLNFATKKPSARLATAAPLSPANTYTSGVLTATGNGVLTVDGINPGLNDVLLVKDEADPKKNGLYNLTTLGSSSAAYQLTRNAEMDAGSEFHGFLEVINGTVNAGSLWLCPPDAITVGSSAITFYQWFNRWQASAMAPGMTINIATGQISGPATTAGVYNFNVIATATAGLTPTWSSPLSVTLGIEPRAVSARTGFDMFIDDSDGSVGLGTGATASTGPLIAVREEDDLLFYVHFQRTGTGLDLGTLGALEFAVKELEPESVLVVGGGTTSAVDFVKVGTGVNTAYVMHASFHAQALASALGNYEADTGTSFVGLGQIMWSELNTSGVGPTYLRRSTKMFQVQIDRNIVAS